MRNHDEEPVYLVNGLRVVSFLGLIPWHIVEYVELLELLEVG